MPLPPLRDPTDTRTRIVSLSRAVPVSGYLLTTLMLGNLGQTASLAALPFSRRAFRRLNRELADAWWGHCVTLSRLLNRARVVVTGDPVPMRENAVVVANHQQMPDITFLMMFARSKDRLGDMKWFVKDQLKWVPGIGWGMVFLDCLFVRRDWAEDEASIARTFAGIVRDQVPLWLILFAEGTRITPDKIERSRAYAAERGLRPTEHVLQPRTKGFVASLKGLRGHVDAVYDITIGYEEGVPTLWQFIKGLSTVAHLHVHRTPVAELPRSDEALARWLQERYQVKDRLLAHFYQHGAFPSG